MYLAIVLCALAATFFVWRLSVRKTVADAEHQFSTQTAEVASLLEKRLELYVATLYAARGLFSASAEVDYREWSKFFTESSLLERYPGISVIRYAKRVRPNELEDFLNAVRETATSVEPAYLQFRVFPEVKKRPGDDYFVVLYQEPFRGHEQRLGFDIASERERRAALMRAQKSGEATATGRVDVVTMDGSEPGFLVFLPIYRNDVVVETSAERRDALIGFANALFKSRELFVQALEGVASLGSIDFEIYDADGVTDANLIFDSNQQREVLQGEEASESLLRYELQVADTKWQLFFTVPERSRLHSGGTLASTMLLCAGLIFCALLSVVFYLDWSAFRRATAMAKDMTKSLRKEMRHRRIAEEKSQRAMKVKSDFLSIVSHELRTPLTAIRESISIVNDQTCGPITEEQSEFLDIAQRNVERLSRLINDVLDYQKLDEGAMTLQKAPGDLNELLKRVHADYLLVARNRGLEFRLECDPDVPPLSFDPDKIIQVLSNLLSNAFKFTEEGTLTIRSLRMEQYVHVAVQDSGPGIAAMDLPKLFQSFSQLEGSHERKTGGTGLGLAISRKILDLHQGEIWVESQPGEGSTFYFSLPIDPDA